MQLSLRPLITTCTVASAYSIHSKRQSGMRSQQARTVTKYSLDRDEAVQKQHLRQFWKKFKHWKKIAALQEGSWFPSLSVSKAQNTVSTLSHTKTHVCSTYPRWPPGASVNTGFLSKCLRLKDTDRSCPLYLGNWQTRSCERFGSSHWSVCIAASVRVCLDLPTHSHWQAYTICTAVCTCLKQGCKYEFTFIL